MGFFSIEECHLVILLPLKAHPYFLCYKSIKFLGKGGEDGMGQMLESEAGGLFSRQQGPEHISSGEGKGPCLSRFQTLEGP